MLMRSKARNVPAPLLGAIAATRAMLGFGAGLLASRRIKGNRSRVLGWTLLGVGLATTIPLAAMVLRRR
jgi:hypothetical protein